jgi:colicin import membrane protein
MAERALRTARVALGLASVMAALLASGPQARAQGEGGLESERAAAPVSDGAPRIEPLRVLGSVDPEREMSPDEARALQSAVREAREDSADGLLRERIACYRRFFVTACLADVGRRERQVRARLDRLEVAANRTMREHSALELNARTAAELERREATEPDDSARREENRRAYESRQAAAELEQARREAQAPDLARQAEANRSERARREAGAAARRRDAETRSIQDAPNAAARASALEVRRLEREAGDAREALQRESRKADRERREEAARKREASPRPVGPARPARPPADTTVPREPAGPGPGPSAAPVAPSAPAAPAAPAVPAVPAVAR